MQTEKGLSKPRLIYDGDCGFCLYSINYWRKLTGNAVEYRPYQEVAKEYPAISIQEFQRAVQYVAPDGKIAHAAEASFLTLSHAPGMSCWLWLYRHIPGFAFIFELFYSLISKNRNFFYTICRFCWGDNYEPPTYSITTWLFLRAFGFIFLIAFYSFSTQALGLIGSDGIIPVTELVKAGNQQLGSIRYWYLPMVFWLNSSDVMVQLVCSGGMIFSLLLIFNVYPRFSLFMLYLLYLALVVAGQVFMAFQWDLLLLEIAPIAMVLLTTRTLGIWLLRWLLFRFIIAGGMVKFFSGDISWRDLTALDYHFYTQPLPTPIAWYAAKLPEVILKAGTAFTLITELSVVFLIFAPRRIRFIAGFIIMLFQLFITLTGNYNFFNLTVFALCISLYDDAALRYIIPERMGNLISYHFTENKPYFFTKILAYFFAFFTIILSGIQFGLRFGLPISLYDSAINSYSMPLHIVNTYGPFAIVTKQRDEIIIEGSNDGIYWYPYEFKYKPGNVDSPLKWNIPFQPRLDWQMWFAALSEPESNPWFYLFLQRLLQNSPSVTALLEYNPFAVTGAKYIRATFYDYKFTNFKERSETGATWKREYIKEYVQTIRLN